MNTILYQADTILQFYDNQEPRDAYYADTDKMYSDPDYNGEGEYGMNDFI